ncbi:MAG: membrane protein insertion efficiency factor YidD [Acidobacteriia bacterium]|nr:membrane protein insertion efficiency factor YidD [Terriglobia bacterium]
MKTLLQLALRFYKRWISPALPPSCRYVPSCSEFAMEAIERHGTVRGSGMAIWRLLRCHPFAKGGYDPVLSTGYRVLSTSSSTRTHSHGK